MIRDHRRPPPTVLGSPAVRATFLPSVHRLRGGVAIQAAGRPAGVSVAVALSEPRELAGVLPSPPRGERTSAATHSSSTASTSGLLPLTIPIYSPFCSVIV